MTTRTNTRIKAARTLTLTPEILIGVREAAAACNMSEVCFCRTALREYFRSYLAMINSGKWAAGAVTIHPGGDTVDPQERFEGAPLVSTVGIDAETDSLLTQIESDIAQPMGHWYVEARRALLFCTEAAVWHADIDQGFRVEVRRATWEELEHRGLWNS